MHVLHGSIADLMESLTRLSASAHMDFVPDLDSDAMHNDCYEDYWLYSIYHRRSPKNPCEKCKKTI